MSIETALTLPEEAFQYVTQHNLVTAVGVRPDVLLDLEHDDVEKLVIFGDSMGDMRLWIITDMLTWAEEQAAKLTQERNTRSFWDARNQLWGAILKLCKTEIAKHTAYNMAACGRAWPYERRRHTERISYEHHRLLSSKTEEEQEYWMDLAEAGEWSVARLRAALYSGDDPLEPITYSPRPELWPRTKIEEEVSSFFEEGGYLREYMSEVIEPLVELIERIKKEIRDEQAKHYS